MVDRNRKHFLIDETGQAFSQYFTTELEVAYQYVDLLCLHLCFYLVHECKLFEGDSGSILTLLNRKDLVSDARYLVTTVLDVLAEEGILSINGDTWIICRPCPYHQSEELQRQATANCPAAAAIFELIERTRRHMR